MGFSRECIFVINNVVHPIYYIKSTHFASIDASKLHEAY